MASDIGAIVRNLLEFYDFSAKTVIDVGAGGGQMAEYSRPAGKVIAVDPDAAALSRLAVRLEELGLREKFELVVGDFLKIERQADAVLFEFSLHEIADPAAALRRARSLALDVVVIDHLPESVWSFYAAEEDKVAASWGAIRAQAVRRFQSFLTQQFFHTYAELLDKVRTQGGEALRRIEAFRGKTDFAIPMPYGIALLQKIRGRKKGKEWIQ